MQKMVLMAAFAAPAAELHELLEFKRGPVMQTTSFENGMRGLRLHLACCSVGVIIQGFAALGSTRIHPAERGRTA